MAITTDVGFIPWSVQPFAGMNSTAPKKKFLFEAITSIPVFVFLLGCCKKKKSRVMGEKVKSIQNFELSRAWSFEALCSLQNKQKIQTNMEMCCCS